MRTVKMVRGSFNGHSISVRLNTRKGNLWLSTVRLALHKNACIAYMNIEANEICEEKELAWKTRDFTQLAVTQYGFLMHSSVICVSLRQTWLMFESRHISLAPIRNFGVHCGHELPRTSGIALFRCPTKCMSLLLSPRAQVDTYSNISYDVAWSLPLFNVFNDAVSNSNDWIRVNNELKCGMNRNFKVPYRHLSGDVDKNHKSFSQYSRCPSRDSNRSPLENKSEELPLELTCSMSHS
jgi:hypothetical protein